MEYKKIDLEVEQLLARLARRLSSDDITRINDAYLLAREAHMEQRRKSGEPYIMHPVAVAKIVAEELRLGANPIIAAFLHDVVEDTDYDFDDIEAEGFTAEVIEALRLLTHDKQTPYEEYIERICRSGNRTAINVKMNDLRHNLARGREGNHLRYVEKHTRALAFIEGYLSQLEN